MTYNYQFEYFTEKENKVINMRFGKEMTYSKIAKELDVTIERIRQIEKQTFRKIYKRFIYLEGREKIFKEISNFTKIRFELNREISTSIFSKLIEEVFSLNVRTYNCLQREHIFYIGDLVIRTESEILKFENSGRKTLNNLKDCLKEYNLSFGMILNNWPPNDLVNKNFNKF